jgi:hypothetical protein
MLIAYVLIRVEVSVNEMVDVPRVERGSKTRPLFSESHACGFLGW